MRCWSCSKPLVRCIGTEKLQSRSIFLAGVGTSAQSSYTYWRHLVDQLPRTACRVGYHPHCGSLLAFSSIRLNFFNSNRSRWTLGDRWKAEVVVWIVLCRKRISHQTAMANMRPGGCRLPQPILMWDIPETFKATGLDSWRREWKGSSNSVMMRKKKEKKNRGDWSSWIWYDSVLLVENRLELEKPKRCQAMWYQKPSSAHKSEDGLICYSL